MQKEDALGHSPLPARVETSMSKCPISRALVEVTSPQPLNDAVPNGTLVTGYSEVSSQGPTALGELFAPRQSRNPI